MPKSNRKSNSGKKPDFSGGVSETGKSFQKMTFNEEEDENFGPSLASILNRPIPNGTTGNNFNFKPMNFDQQKTGNLYASSEDDDDCEDAVSGSDSDDSEKRFLLKKAIGICPEDVRSYDNKSEPLNGSQYLLAVRKHNKHVPKVVSVDLKILEEKMRKQRIRKSEGNEEISGHGSGSEPEDDVGSGSESPRYNSSSENKKEEVMNQIEMIKDGDLVSTLFPKPEWSNSALQDFARMRAKVNRLRNLIEQRKVIVNLPANVKLPIDNNPTFWEKFCLGTYLSERKRFSKRCFYPEVEFNSFLEEFFSSRPYSETPIETSILPVEVSDPDPDLSTENLPHTEDSEADKTTQDSDQAMNPPASVRCPVPAHVPLLSILLNISQRQLERLLNTHKSWLKYNELLHSHQAKWLYAILACIQEPLEGSVMSDIREIAKKCITTRTKLFKFLREEHPSLNGVNLDNLEQYTTTLNLFVCIVSRYFRQLDLSDDFIQSSN